jgi:Flp pilus assembly protein TadD
MSELDRGWQLHQAGRYREAEVIYSQALLQPAQQANAWCFLGILYYDIGNFDESLKAYERALQIQPQFPVALSNRANTLSSLDRLDEAVQSCEQAIELKPDYATVWTNLGAVQTKRGAFEEASESFRKSLELSPEKNEAAHRNLGAMLVQQGRLDEGETHTSRALQLNPQNAEAHRNHAIIQLLRGNYGEGWEEYEWRWHCADLQLPEFGVPIYDGEPLEGKTVLLHAEQGLGDALHFVRYGELLKKAGARVVVQCHPPLCQIFQSYEFADQIVPREVELPNIDFHLPMMSAPRVFGTRLDNIPNGDGYLSADPSLQRKWKPWLDEIDGWRIGIVWQGSRDHRADQQRSFNLGEFAPLAAADVTFVPLQVGEGRAQITAAPGGMRIADPGDRLDRDCGPFMDTAAIVSQLDLVICCDTSIAHLSAALGVPTWIALSVCPDWRWLLEREDSPWYPSVRLFRQSTANQWGDVFERMRQELTLQTMPTRSVKRHSAAIQVEVGAGELLDKLTILEIKASRIDVPEKLKNVLEELETLQRIQSSQLPWTGRLRTLYDQLAEINIRLWDVEDDIRDCDRQGDFGPEFVELARSVYRLNDQRAALKREINTVAGSRIVEEKSYAAFDQS